MDPEVHGFANSMVDRLPYERTQEPTLNNGSGPKAFKSTLMQKQDIANAEVRPDVYTTVKKMINPVPLWRSNKAPKTNYEAWWGEGKPPPR
jgi:cysteinyl-tRNA synthetase